MKKYIPILFFFVCLNVLGNAQTKLISHKSHSGNKTTFKKALEGNLFDMGISDFGQAPMRMVKNAVLDSLIFLSDTSAIMVTSEHCKVIDRGRTRSSSVWKAGKDTLEYHPLFIKKHSLDSIKQVIELQYNFNNSVDSVVFVGYDNEKPEVVSTSPKLTRKEKRKEKKKDKKLKKKKRQEEKMLKKEKMKPDSERPIVMENQKDKIIHTSFNKNTSWNLFGIMTLSSFLFSFMWIKLR